MAVTPSVDPKADIHTALELLTGVLVAMVESSDMVAYERVEVVAGQVAILLEWAIDSYPPPEDPTTQQS